MAMAYYAVYPLSDGSTLSPRAPAGATLYPVPPEGGAYVGVPPSGVQLAYPSVVISQAPPPVTYVMPSPREESKMVVKGTSCDQIIFRNPAPNARLYVPVRQKPVVKHRTVLKNTRDDRHKTYLCEKVKYVYDYPYSGSYPYNGWYMMTW